MKRSRKFIFKRLILLSFMIYVMFLSSCLSNLLSGTASASDVSKAVDPEGLKINTNNVAYLYGPVRSIDGHRIVVKMGILISESASNTTPVRVPAGKQLNVNFMGTITHNYRKSDDSWDMGKDVYETIQDIIIPPLEKDGIYKLSTGNYDINVNQRLLVSFDVFLNKLNKGTNKYEYLSTQKINLNPPLRPKN